MSKIRSFVNISSQYGIGFAIIAAWRFLTGGRRWVARFELERRWPSKLADSHNLVGAEIGVRDGRHAFYLINALDIEKLYLIDPYEAYEEYSEDWATDDMMTEVETTAREKLGGFKSTKFIRQYSNDAISDISEDLDFVYIDGNHEYEFVKDDIANYYPLLKEGGMLAGHDYNANWPGVVQAVDEFSQKHGLQVQRAMFSDWFIIKQTTE
jgi:hypothetical protein